jgi:eukaryotic-like serine/threonine-protein kinase
MSPQSSIGHYRIVAKLGEGGMGAVYRATDTKLNRDVAIKVLPPAFAEDAARMARFEREAQVLASLNHANIAAIYGVEQGAIVMELVEGADLVGPLPVDTVIDYARQLAAGLEAAHEKGIVHRDLKPANIKVTPDGILKVLDFGLAKAREETNSTVSTNATMSPTMSLAMTQAGMILGTAAYMSPEQARGKPVDRRADIWAYGIVLFELLTGRHPYGTGETVTDTLAAIVLKEADLAALPADTPPRLRRLIERCLRKDPKVRLRDIGEARVLLDEPEPAAPALTAKPAARRAWLPWTVAGLAVAIAAGIGAYTWLRVPADQPGPGAMHFLLPLPPDTGMPQNSAATQWVPSPDGRNIAMVLQEKSGTNYVWVRPLDATVPHRLDKTEGANYPFWSPDSQSIGFFALDKLKRVAVSGGAVQTVCSLEGLANRSPGDGAAWNKDSSIIFAVAGKPLMRVPASGGIPAAIMPLEKDQGYQQWPQILPDGKHVLYLARGGDPRNDAIYIQELGSAKRVQVLKTPGRAVWSEPGYLLFAREGTLFAQRIDSKTFHLEGEALSIAEEVLTNDSVGRSTFAVSQNGSLVYRTGSLSSSRQLTWRDRGGKVLGPVGKPEQIRSVVVSPDGNSAALVIGSGAFDVWVMDVSTGVITPMTRDGKVTVNGIPSWSPDSQKLAISTSSGVQEITVASGKMTLLGKEPEVVIDWSPDGRSILGIDAGGNRLSLATLAPQYKVQTILTTPHRQSNYRFSPDGKFVAYSSDEAGSIEVFIASFPSFAVKRRVSSGGGVPAVWGPDGKELFYRSASGAMMAVEVHTGSNLQVGIPKQLFSFGSGIRGNRFAVSRDGQRFLTSEPLVGQVNELPYLNLIVNWMAKLKTGS